MKTSTQKLAQLVLAFACSTTPITMQAKRVAATPVAPVVQGSVRYSSDGDGRDQYVVAADAQRGNVLWRVKIFHNSIDPEREEDVQWVFIRELKVVKGMLFVKDEKSRCYVLDLQTRTVKDAPCADTF